MAENYGAIVCFTSLTQRVVARTKKWPSLSCFIAGVVVSIPVALGMGALIYGAILDGRENDRIQAEGNPDEPADR